MTAYDPRCECEACQTRRYANFGQVLKAGLQHDAPGYLSAVVMTRIRPLSANQRRALLVPTRRRTKENIEGNANR